MTRGSRCTRAMAHEEALPLKKLLQEIRACTLCAEQLPQPPQPILAASAGSRILLIGQAPGAKTLTRGLPFSDASGVRLRDWLGVSEQQFYDPELFAIVPMGFCFPGSGTSGDMPPRPECAPQWHSKLLAHMQPQLTLLIGRYAIDAYAPGTGTLATRIRERQDSRRQLLPHPSPRNNLWLRKNPWFEQDTLPSLRRRVQSAIP